MDTKQKKKHAEMVKKAVAAFLELDFAEAARASDCRYNRQLDRFEFDYFGQSHYVHCCTGHIYPEKSTSTDKMLEELSIINYFNRYKLYKNVPLRRKWVSLMEIPGASLFMPAFRQTALNRLAKAFSNEASLLYQAVQPLKGTKSAQGDASINIWALPKIPLKLVVWEDTTSGGPSANIYYDSSIPFYAHIDDILNLGVFAVNRVLTYCGR